MYVKNNENRPYNSIRKIRYWVPKHRKAKFDLVPSIFSNRKSNYKGSSIVGFFVLVCCSSLIYTHTKSLLHNEEKATRICRWIHF